MESIWVIGDVHGCRDSLDALLARPEIADDPRCRFWFVGDLVNRGPASAATLRRVRALGERATVVLGNHDLRALAVAAGCLRPGRRDTLDELLRARDATSLLDWLRRQPLLHAEAGHLLVHAGLYPRWDPATAMARAREVEALLRHPRWRQLLPRIRGPSPLSWRDTMSGAARLRFIVRAFTQMRLCRPDGTLAPHAKAAPGRWPSGMLPWFDVPGRQAGPAPVLFGHWATLGLLVRSDVVCLDTGCVSGGVLTALRLADRKLLQVGREALRPVPA